MIDLKYLREHMEEARAGLARKGYDVKKLTPLLEEDASRRKMLQEVETLKAERNRVNDEIAQANRARGSAKPLIERMKTLSQKIKESDTKVEEITSLIDNLIITIPNIPHKSTPNGESSANNKEIRKWGETPNFGFKPKDHIELATGLGWISFQRAAKMTGAGFAMFQGGGAKLVRALINFMVDLHSKEHGYTEIWPPSLVNRLSMTGTGQLPNLEADMYRLKDDDYFLIPTAEVPVSNMHRDEVLAEEVLPLRYVAYTPCFRREAGSYGKDTKGLARVHQFDKVELVKFVTPDSSLDELESLVRDAEKVLQLLELPYRVSLLCAGDLSFAGAKCYDLEAFAPATNRWFEVSSCSAFFDFQARRMNIKFKSTKGGKAQYAHTLNGSGVALARTIICLLENHQQPDGTIKIPKALERYL